MKKICMQLKIKLTNSNSNKLQVTFQNSVVGLATLILFHLVSNEGGHK